MNFVSVMVPEELVTDVYRFIAEQTGKRTVASEEPDGQRDEPVVSRGWTAKEIKRAYKESPPAMIAFLNTLAAHPGEWLGTKELSDPLSAAVKREYGWQEMAGMLGAFGRRISNRYKKKTWFFDAERDHENNRWVYRMNPELAELFLAMVADLEE